MKTENITAPTYALGYFDWDKAEGILSSFDSDFQRDMIVGRIWPDSADCGFHIYSLQTGKTESFYFDSQNKNQDGDITEWIFKPTDSKSRVKKVLIFND